MSEANPSLAFLSDNARNEDDRNIVDWFIDMEVFWSLFSEKHTIIYGSRGSGKTFLSKMASFPLLRQSEMPRAKQLVGELNYVGVFVNTDVRFVGSTSSPVWINDQFRETHFVWKFNINCVKSICTVIDNLLCHCISDDVERFKYELHISKIISGYICLNDIPRLKEIDFHLSRYEYDIRSKLNKAHLRGEAKGGYLSDAFSTDILEPVLALINELEHYLPILKTTKWLLFIDEAEFLLEEQQRILNTFMRTHTNRIFLKIATLPFHYRTFDTNVNVSLQAGDDYQQEFLDSAPIYTLNKSNAADIYKFAIQLYSIRMKKFLQDQSISVSNKDYAKLSDLGRVLYHSRILNPKRKPDADEFTLRKLKKHVNAATYRRSQELLANNPAAFDNSIWRKVAGQIEIREHSTTHRLGQNAIDIYSGLEIAIRCTDGIPRRMINLFQKLAREAMSGAKNRNKSAKHLASDDGAILDYKIQNRVLSSYADDRFANSLAVPRVGPELNTLINNVGQYLRAKLHDDEISTDYIGSFFVDVKCTDVVWEVVMAGIAYGHIFPNVSSKRPLTLSRESSFRLSFAYSPKFLLYPAQGKPRALSSILPVSTEANTPAKSVKLAGRFDSEQLQLFE